VRTQSHAFACTTRSRCGGSAQPLISRLLADMRVPVECGAVRCRRVVKAHQDGSVPDKHDVRAIAIVFQRNQPMPVPFGAL